MQWASADCLAKALSRFQIILFLHCENVKPAKLQLRNLALVNYAHKRIFSMREGIYRLYNWSASLSGGREGSYPVIFRVKKMTCSHFLIYAVYLINVRALNWVLSWHSYFRVCPTLMLNIHWNIPGESGKVLKLIEAILLSDIYTRFSLGRKRNQIMILNNASLC